MVKGSSKLIATIYEKKKTISEIKGLLAFVLIIVGSYFDLLWLAGIGVMLFIDHLAFSTGETIGKNISIRHEVKIEGMKEKETL